MNTFERAPDHPQFPAFERGEVWLVGAGPGDPRLLTLMAVHALRSCDVVVHDELIDPRVLDHLRPGADIESAGKRGGQPSPHQSHINERLIVLARENKRVLRLKGGDPFVFGRGGEEALALARAGVRFRIVPGLTSGLAGAALAGIPATTRETNHAVILATGHRAVDADSTRDWEAMARTGQPVILYMAMTHLADIAAAFMRGGMAPDTPVAIIGSATFPAERVLQSELHRAAADAEANNVGAPAIVVVGRIAALRSELLASLAGATP
jgi:uroporphyrin-III C-methyltransferase